MRRLFVTLVSLGWGIAYSILFASCLGMAFILPHFGRITIWQALEYVTCSPVLLMPELQKVVWMCYGVVAIALFSVATANYLLTKFFFHKCGIKGMVVLNAAFMIFWIDFFYLTFELADDCFCLRYEIRCLSTPSMLFHDEFHEVKTSDVKFVAKRNLIVLVGESIEEDFIKGPSVGINLMPRLQKWRSGHDTFGEMLTVHGCNHTICSLFGMVYGSPRLQIGAVPRPVSFSEYPEAVMPNAWRIWLDNGFNCKFIKGGSVHFACTDKVFRTVPEVVIHDKEFYDKDPDYVKEPQKNEFGVNDEVTIVKHLRKETLELSHASKPFVLVAWTLNTHCDGWRSSFKPHRHKDTLYDAVMQTDDMIIDYLEWAEKQPFAKDTEIVFVGDHTAHFDFAQTKNEDRRVVNVLVSKVVPPIKGKRTFAAFDLAPTFLELTGALLPDHRFGLGTSLLSDKQTLLERIGRERYEGEIRACGRDYRRIALGWEN